MFCRTFVACDTTSKPATDAFPDVGFKRVVSIIIVVLLPAPFGPRKPKISPVSTLNEMLSTAFTLPNSFVRESVSIAYNEKEDILQL